MISISALPALLLGLWKNGSLTRWGMIAGAAGLIFLTGVGVGNVRATRTFVAQVQDRADKEIAAKTGALFVQWKAENAALSQHLKEDAALGRRADDTAVATLTKARDDARHDAALALQQLNNNAGASRVSLGVPAPAVNSERKNFVEVSNVACPETRPFTFGPDARRLLNNAAGLDVPAGDPAPRGANPYTETAGRSVAGTGAGPSPAGR